MPAFVVYLILVGVILFVAIPALLIVYARYWNGSKFLKAQMAKAPIDTFGGTVSKWKDYTFSDEDERYFQKLQGDFFDKAFTAKGTMLISIASSLFTILIPMLIILIMGWDAPWYLWLFGILLFPIPVVAFYRGSYKRYRNIEAEREAQIKRMFDVANSALKFDPMAAFMPSSVVNVTKWKDKTIPQSVIILYPTTFRADNQGSRESFESAFNNAITEDNAWIYTWHPTKNAIQCRPVEDLPKMVEYKGAGPFEWHTFPLGVGLGPKGQEIISYSVNKNKTGIYYPHVLVAGTTGSGKSVIQRNIIFHCIQHNDMWRFLGVDLKRVELSRFKRYTKTVLGIATDLEQGVEVVKYAHDVMMERYAKMEEAGVNIFLDMVDENGKPEYAILLMVDEAFMFMSPEGNKSEEGKRNDMLHAEASHILGNIARLGRAAGVHLVLATQRPDATVIKGELKNNLDVRIAAGRLDSTPSLMVLDSGAGTLLPPIKGRGLVRLGAETRMFQGFFAEQDWIDNWLAKPQNRWREPDLFKDKASASKAASDFEPIDDLEEDFIDIEMDELEEVDELDDSDVSIDDLLEATNEPESIAPPPLPPVATGVVPMPPMSSVARPSAEVTIEDEELEEIDNDEIEELEADDVSIPSLSDNELEDEPTALIVEGEDSMIEDIPVEELHAELERNFMFDDEIDDFEDSNISEEEIEQLLLELAKLDDGEESDEELSPIDFDEPETGEIKVNPALATDDFLDDEELEETDDVSMPSFDNEDKEALPELESIEDEDEPTVAPKVDIRKIGSLIIADEDEPLTIDKPVLDNAMPIRPAFNDTAKSTQVATPAAKPATAAPKNIPARPSAPSSPSEILKKRPQFPSN